MKDTWGFDEERIKILIADSDIKRMKSIACVLEADGMIEVKKCVQSGKAALKEIISDKYNLAIICISLTENDGLWVLEELQKSNSNSTKVIAVNDFGNTKISEIVIKLGADYCITKPFDKEIIKKRILQLCEYDGTKPEIKKSYEVKISEFIGKLGVKPNLKGYRYLKFAIPYIIANNHGIDVITKELYPEIAKVFNTEPKSVERNIRNCIELSWATAADKYRNIFGYEFKKRPTNKEFLHTVVDYIMENFMYI